MSALAIIVLVIGIIVEFKKKRIALHNHASSVHFLDILVVIVLGLAFMLPAQALSSKAIGRKSINTPSYDESTKINTINTPCPQTKPVSIEKWVYEINEYPINCYEGQSIELTGFVFEAFENPLPNDMYYLGRVVMSCCVIDARPYALPIKKANFISYPENTWLKVNGKLKADKVNGKIQLIISPDSVTKVSNPDKPYEYMNVPL